MCSIMGPRSRVIGAGSAIRCRLRHSLSSLVSVLVAAVACRHSGPLAIAQAAAGWDQEVVAAHGCRVRPATGKRTPPSASTVNRLPALLDAEEVEAALSC